MNKAFIQAREMALKARGTARRPMARKAAKTATGELYLYDVIGAGWFAEGITAKAVAEALAGMKDCKALNIYINSEGGDVFEGKAIHNVLKRFEGTKTVYVDGICASIATHIAMAGDKIITAPNATWMIHEAWTIVMGNAESLRHEADVIDQETQSLAEAYAVRSKKLDAAGFRDLMKKETWFNAQDALAHGLTDMVSEEDDDEEDDEEMEHKMAALLAVSPVAAAFKNIPARLTGKRADNAAKLAALDMDIHSLCRASPAAAPGQPGK